MRGRLSQLVLALLVAVFLWPGVGVAQEERGCLEPLTYTVQRGDTLSAIADRFGTDVATLAALNHLADPDHLLVGQRLRLPCAVSVGELAMVAALSGRSVGRALAVGKTSVPWVEALVDRAGVWREMAEAGIPAAVAWYPSVVRPGDVVAVRVLPDPGHELTATLQVAGTWYPLQPVGKMSLRATQAAPQATDLAAADSSDSHLLTGTTRALVGLVPLDGFATPGLLQIPLRVGSGDRAVTVKLPVWVREGDFPVQHVFLPPAKAKLLDPELIRKEDSRLYELWTSARTLPRWHHFFRWPVDVARWPTTSPYGMRRSYNGGPVSSYHKGQDIAAPQGTPVRAPAAGVVVLAEVLAVRGNAVVIDHGAGVMSNYWHLSALNVEVGQEVRAGDLLGWVGTTGLSTGAHLHWEMRVHGVAVNPVPWTRVWGPAAWWGVVKEESSASAEAQ